MTISGLFWYDPPGQVLGERVQSELTGAAAVREPE